MAFVYNSEFVFIGKGDESFLENYSYELDDDPEGKGGRIFMSLEIVNNLAEAEDIGEAIFANFKQAFYAHEGADAYERFEEALKQVNKTIETLKEEKVSRFIGNLNVAIGSIVDDTLYISVTGDAEVYLVRKKFVSVVSEGLSEEAEGETFVNIANGGLEVTDRVLFSSSRLLRYITKAEMGKIFSEEGINISDALAELQDFVMAEILGRSAVIGVNVGATIAGRGEYAQEEEGGMFDETPAANEKVAALFKGWLTSAKSWFKMPAISSGTADMKFSWFTNLREKAAKLVPQKWLPGAHTSLPSIPLPGKTPKERILIAAIVLLAMLVGGVFWLRANGSKQQQIQALQAQLNRAQELINEASTVGQFDKAKASDLIVSAEKEALQVLSSRYLRAQAVRTLDDLQKQRDSLDAVIRVSNPAVLADLTEKQKNASLLGMLSLKDHLYAFEYNALYEMILDKLQDPLTISDLETVILGSAYQDQNSLLFLTRTGKMIEYANGGFASVTTKDGIWKKGVDMKSYNDKLYILDPDRNQIWRYPRRRDSFDVGEGYNQNADLKNAVSLAIDSSIYVLNSDGTITLMYQGQKQDFPLRKPPLAPLAAPTKIYTAPELSYIFILEPSKQRVVLYRKDPKNGGAQYQTQYVFDKIGTLRDLVVADNRLYVADDKRVYFINLSGL